MSDGNGTSEGSPQARPNFIVTFEVAMTTDGPAVRSSLNRDPDLFEIALLQSKLFTMMVRGALIFKELEDRAIAQQRTIVAPTNGGPIRPPLLPGGIHAPTP